MNPSMKPTLQESMKLLGEMTLLNRFLFSEVMSDPEVYTAALQIILGEDELKLLTGAQTEKEIKTTPWLRSIRLDVIHLFLAAKKIRTSNWKTGQSEFS